MKQNAQDRRQPLQPKAVQSVEANVKNWKLRVAVVALLLAVGLYFIGTGLYQALSKNNGWQEITATSNTDNSCVSQFTLLYDLGHSGTAATVEYKQIAALYAQAAQNAYKLFNAYESFDGFTNLHDLGSSPNRELTVDPALYKALEQIVQSGSRLPFLAPVYEQYFTLFNCQDDSQAVNFDPFVREELARYFREVCAFVSNPEHIAVELLGNNKVRLAVSQEYLEFAEKEQIDQFLDLFWMEQAFQIDYIADALQENGHTYAALSGKGGFSRVLDPREDGMYHTGVLSYNGVSSLIVGRTAQTGPLASVCLRDYSLVTDPVLYSYTYADGTLRSCFIDPRDGMCKTAFHDIMAYSGRVGCAEIALNLAPLYIRETLDEQGINDLRGSGIYSVFCRDQKICYNDSALQIVDIYTSQALSYTKNYIG